MYGHDGDRLMDAIINFIKLDVGQAVINEVNILLRRHNLNGLIRRALNQLRNAMILLKKLSDFINSIIIDRNSLNLIGELNQLFEGNDNYFEVLFVNNLCF